MLTLLIFESITANLKNIKKSGTQLSIGDFKKILHQGKGMISALYSDLQRVRGINLIVGKQRYGETKLEFFSNISPKIDAAWIIAPESEGELEDCFVALKEKLWIGSGLNAIRLASDKLKTKKYLKHLGVNTPELVTEESFNQNVCSKTVLKPTRGAGSVDTYIINPEENNVGLIERSPDSFLEEWIDGKPMSVSLNCKPFDFEILSINEQYIAKNPTGRLIYNGVRPVDKKIFYTVKEILHPILDSFIPNLKDLRGFVGIDFILAKNFEISIIEINPRLTCSYIGMSEHRNNNVGLKILKSFGVKDLR